MRKLALITAISLILAGCGGGSSDSNNTNEVRTPSSIQGTIDSVSGDTIVVNGYTYHVDSAHYSGEDVAIADLEKNMMVSISSNPRSASAHSNSTQVGLEPTIVGLISNTDHANGTFEVNGIPLTFSALSTEIENGDWVMVSSLPTANAGYKVLSVVKFEHSNLTESVEVEGLISELDSNEKTFKLGANLSVDYSNAHIDNDDNSSGLSNGLWVEVTGSMTGSVLTANEVEIEDFDEVSNDTEIEGIITWIANDQSSFDLSYKGRFLVNDSTRYEDGNKSNLTVGAEVEVTTKKAKGDNVATEIEFEHDDDAQDWNDNDIDLEGIVQSIDEQALSFVIQTTSGNQTVYVNQNTRYEDGLTFNTLPNQRVEAEAYKVNNQYIASEIEAEDND
ncbi:DUF5666 domain-containing protein [uncultured Vibrio sp.]|uniref:DUF5666 domain-containing protein n=1 Tax=uncultured Vibrio sp. TaxID=114054 RepID=UPI00260AB229|nr:DUF5666 domain-containing protein [uncultured Vibrio sp.]